MSEEAAKMLKGQDPKLRSPAIKGRKESVPSKEMASAKALGQE